MKCSRNSGSISSKKYDSGVTHGDISSDIKCKKEEDILINILLATKVSKAKTFNPKGQEELALCRKEGILNEK